MSSPGYMRGSPTRSCNRLLEQQSEHRNQTLRSIMRDQNLVRLLRAMSFAVSLESTPDPKCPVKGFVYSIQQLCIGMDVTPRVSFLTWSSRVGSPGTPRSVPPRRAARLDVTV